MYVVLLWRSLSRCPKPGDGQRAVMDVLESDAMQFTARSIQARPTIHDNMSDVDFPEG